MWPSSCCARWASARAILSSTACPVPSRARRLPVRRRVRPAGGDGHPRRHRPADLQLQMARDPGRHGLCGHAQLPVESDAKAEEQGISLSLRRAVTTAEPLPPVLRQTLVGSYGLEVIHTYATAELGVLAVNSGEGWRCACCRSRSSRSSIPTAARSSALARRARWSSPTPTVSTRSSGFGTGDLAMNVDPRPGESRQENGRLSLVGRRGEAIKVRGMFLHPNQLRFAAAQVPGVRATQAVITRPDGARDHLALRVEMVEGG